MSKSYRNNNQISVRCDESFESTKGGFVKKNGGGFEYKPRGD